MKTLRSMAGLAAAMVFLLVPLSATASPETLQRSVGNIVQAPLDLALSPLVAWSTLNNNIQDIEDTTGVRIAYYLPGFIWLTGVNVGASVLRGVTGALELLPGLMLLPFDADLDPMFDPVERAEGLVEFDNVVMPVKFGIAYQVPAY